MLKRQLLILRRREYHIPIPIFSLSHPRRCSSKLNYSSTSLSTTNRSNISLTTRFPLHSHRSSNVINYVRPAIIRQTRTLSTATFISILTPPLVLVGLTVSLWLYKCLMMIIFQNKIIYMPSMPPFSRSEKIEDYQADCRPVEWREERIQSLDGVEIALCVGCYGRAWKRGGRSEDNNNGTDDGKRRKQVVVLYFQGNGSSTPPRLPLLSSVLKQLYRNSAVDTDISKGTEYTIVAPSYRGFWTSRGRPSQPGIELDALASLAWVKDQFKPTAADTNTQIVLWGQSIGAGVATGLAAANHTQARNNENSKDGGSGDGDVSALILENPFISVPSMLLALYPQRWLPYRYLGPFLRTWWDSEQAIRSFTTTATTTSTNTNINTNMKANMKANASKPKILIISSEKDELVPPDQADHLQDICASSGMDVHRCKVRGALHNDATTRAEGRNAVVQFLQDVHVHNTNSE